MKPSYRDNRGIRSQGPIMASTMSLGIRVFPDNRRTMIDIAAFRGEQIPVTHRLAALLLGTHKTHIGDLVDEGLLIHAGIDRGRSRDFVMIDPSWQLLDVYDRWTAELELPYEYAEFAKFDRICTLCKVPADYPTPGIVIDGLFQRLAEIGLFGRREANMFITFNKVRWIGIKTGLNARLATFCSRRPDVPILNVTLDMFRQSLPEPIASAPRTCFERVVDQEGIEDDGTDYGREPPCSRVRAQVWRLKELFEFGSLYALLSAGQMRRQEQLSDHLTIIARVEEIVRAHAPGVRWTNDVFVEALHAYAIDCTTRPNDTPFVRDITVRLWRVFVWRVTSYLRQQPMGVSAALEPYVPRRFRLSYEFRRELKERYGHLRAVGRAKRKLMSHQAMLELDAIVDATANRRDELRAMGVAVRKEMDDLAVDENSRDVGVTMPILDGRGNLAGGTQTVWLRVWRLDAARSSLGMGSWRRERNKLDGGDEDEDEGAYDFETATARPEFIVEHLRTEAVGPHAARNPYMFELDRLFVASSPASLPDAMKEARHQAIATRGLPGAQPTAAGTISFDMWRARIKRSGAKVGRHFVALEAIEYGMRLAHHALDCVNQSFNRPHEVRQQRVTGWEEIDLPEELGDHEPWHKQMVVGKVQARQDLMEVVPVALTIRESSLNEAIDICELHMRYAGLDRFPVMQAPGDFRWKCPPGKFVFSSNGVIVSRWQLTVLVDYLFVGWPDFALYDFRHANAEDAALDHVHPQLIKLLLGQRSLESAVYYSKLDEWAQEFVNGENLRRRMESQDDRLAQTVGKGEKA